MVVLVVCVLQPNFNKAGPVASFTYFKVYLSQVEQINTVVSSVFQNQTFQSMFFPSGIAIELFQSKSSPSLFIIVTQKSLMLYSSYIGSESQFYITFTYKNLKVKVVIDFSLCSMAPCGTDLYCPFAKNKKGNMIN